MFDLITIGDATFDTFIVLDEKESSCELRKEKKMLCLNYADKTPIIHSVQSAGGNATNVAVGAKKLGLSSAILTELGDDITGHIIRHELEDAGVDTSLIKVLKGKETRYSVVLNYKSERTVLSYYAKRNYSFPHLPQAKWLYYTSLGKSFAALQKKLISHLKKHPSLRLAANPGSYQCKREIETTRGILKYTDILFANKEEAACLAGSQASDIKETMKKLFKEGVKLTVITDSENGSFSYDGEQILHMDAYPVTPIAKTGAGDAYASGFLSAIIRHKKREEAMKWGTANAAGVIQIFGAQRGLCSKRSLFKYISSYPAIAPKIYS
ncbi:MAG: carbohydrate kinase family protein [Candidatus Magasanikbacteria bacterium]|nr:carbohydrate kinase family protein [Candidatus Magasanikbacteria bacterium]